MRRTGLGCVLVVVAACSTSNLFHSRRVSRQDEAGSVHFALISVAPWREYVDALQPRFELSEEDALAQVVPATRFLQESVVDAVQATAGIATPQRVRTKSEVKSSGDTGVSAISGSGEPTFDYSGVETTPGGTQSKVTTETKTESPAFVPSPGVPSVRPLERGTPSTRPPSSHGEPALDPMTRYWAATALFQEVQLLNRYVRDAAVRQGFQAYVVRLQVSLMPSARGEPYDAYCTLGFFAGDDAGAPSSPLRDPNARTDAKPTPQIVPLMVTDNLEAGMQSRALDTVRQLAGAVYAMSYSVGGSADVQSLQETLQSVFGQDLNSLLTVGRVTDNTIRVRLGAQQQASADFAMVPRSHNVTLLLLVPEGGGPSIDVLMRSSMVDAETGEPLPGRTEEEVAALLKRVAHDHGLDGAPPSLLPALLERAQHNDRKGFDALLATAFADEKRVHAAAPPLWVDLVSTMAGSQYAATQFDLPRGSSGRGTSEATIPSDQTALLEDDGTNAIATLRSGGIGGMSAIEATLVVPTEGRDLPIAYESCEIDEVNSTVRLRFPSLSKWHLAQDDGVAPLRLRLTCDGKPIELTVLHRSTPK
jgi:hypothetical protein